MIDSNSKLDHLQGDVVKNIQTTASDLLARFVPGSVNLCPTCLSSGKVMVHQCLVLAHTRRLEEAEKAAARRAVKLKELDNESKARMEAAGRQTEKACLCLFMGTLLCMPELAYNFVRLSEALNAVCRSMRRTKPCCLPLRPVWRTSL